MKGTFKHFFPGGNTSKGFYSFYRYILTQENARRIICLKGGPGTGKSTLMKKVGQYFNEKGYDIEYHHCSSDNNSLDGIVIKGLNVAILDGTSPHVVDPMNPGAVDEILNLGSFWREDGFKDSRNSIISINKQVGKTFKHAYRYIGASRLVHDDWSSYNSEALNLSKLNNSMEKLKNKIFKNLSVSVTAPKRHLFATAFTPNGIVTYIDSICKDYKNIYVLKGGPGTGKTSTLKYIYKEASKRGIYVEVYHDPLIPDRIEHICIPHLDTAILTSNEISKKDFNGITINMENFQNKVLLNKNKTEIEKSKETFYLLLDKGLNLIKQAKSLHDELEKYYAPNMNFDEIKKTTNNLINKILSYEKEYKIK